MTARKNKNLDTESLLKFFMLQAAINIISKSLEKIKEEYGEITDEEKSRAAEFFYNLLKGANFSEEEIHTDWIYNFN